MRAGVIMAGGAGERFWPYSRRRFPKQFLRLTSDKTLLQETIERVSPLIPLSHVYLVIGSHLVDTLHEVMPEFPEENLIIEPEGKNTAPCLALANAVLSKKYENPTVAVLTADHYVKPPEAFLEDLALCLETAENSQALVTIGIQPRHPDTGFGYIEAAQPSKDTPGQVLKVRRFHEKPDLVTARRYVDQGNFFWNSGMFFWTTETFKKVASEVAAPFAQAMQALEHSYGTSSWNRTLSEVYKGLPATSIDYAIMEKAAEMLMVPARFYWDDAGTWLFLERIHEADAQGNVVLGNTVISDTEKCIIYSAPGVSSPCITTLGVKELIIIQTADAILVADKARAQEVKQLPRLLEEKGLVDLI